MARRVTSAVLALFVTFGLFYLMQALITKAAGKLEEPAGSMVDFVRLKKDSDLELKKRKLPKKEEPEEPPPPPDLSLARSDRPDQALEEMGFAVGVEVDVGGPNMGIAASDADIVPIVRVNPQYPPRAADRGIEGWVIVEFTISAAGTVKDPVVLDAAPSSIFNRAALRAIRKWKYNPKTEDGQPVERPGVKVRLNFELEDG